MESVQTMTRGGKKAGIFKQFINIFGLGGNNSNNVNNDNNAISNDKTMWIPDEKAQTCFNCRKDFSAIFLRKHHCRICGNVFCKDCSNKTVDGKYWGSKKEIKVCDYCHKMYLKLDETLIETTVDNPNNLLDDITSINDNMKNLKRETKLSEYCKFYKKDFEECVKFLQMDRKTEEPIKLNLENYFDFLLRQVIDNIFKIDGISDIWIDKIFEISKKAIFQVNPSFRDLKDNLNINDYIKIKTIQHKDISLCKVIDGFAFQKNVCSKNMNTNIENPKILLLDCGLDYYRNNNNITDCETLKLQEPAYLDIIMKKIELVEPNVILVNKNISIKIQEYLSRSNKISLVIYVKSSSLKRIARCTKTYVLPSTDLIDKQTILGTCKRFRIEKVKFSLHCNISSTQNPLGGYKETSNKLKYDNNSASNNINNANNKNYNIINNKENNKTFTNHNNLINNNLKNNLKINLNNNNENLFKNQEHSHTSNQRNSYYDNLKSNEYNLMIFEGCDNLLFGTIILYGPNKEELKKLKKTLRAILLTARDLLLQQHLLYFFYAEIKNINDANHSNQTVISENQSNGNFNNNNNSTSNNNNYSEKENNATGISIQSSSSSVTLFKESNTSLLILNYITNANNNFNNNINFIKRMSQNFNNPFDIRYNINIANIFCCLSKIDAEYNQLSKDFYFGFDRKILYENESRISVVKITMTQGNLNNLSNQNMLPREKASNLSIGFPPSFNKNAILDNNSNSNNISNTNRQAARFHYNINSELGEKELLETINSICDEPEELDLIFYSKEYEYDKPLGKLILDLCAESESKCDICKKLKCNHFYYIYKKTGRLKIQLGQNQEDYAEKIFENINKETADFNKINYYTKSEKEKSIYLNSNSSYNIDIFSYGVCKICKKVVTPLIKLTREIFNFSVAKFFKFMLYNHEVRNRSDTKHEFNLKKHYIAENNCNHFLNKDICRVFISKLGTIKFTYENSPLYIIETSPLHEIKTKKKNRDILEELLSKSKEEGFELLELLKKNFKIFIEELSSDFYKTTIIINYATSQLNSNPNNQTNNSNNSAGNQVNNTNYPANNNNNANFNNSNSSQNNFNEKKEVIDYADRLIKICKKYLNACQEIYLFIDNVYNPLKFKNYLKAMSIIKRVFFRIIQIKTIQDKCKDRMDMIKTLIKFYKENKSNRQKNNDYYENPNFINNAISPDLKSNLSSGVKDKDNITNNSNKDYIYISQLNANSQNSGLVNNINPISLLGNPHFQDNSNEMNICNLDLINQSSLLMQLNNRQSEIINNCESNNNPFTEYSDDRSINKKEETPTARNSMLNVCVGKPNSTDVLNTNNNNTNNSKENINQLHHAASIANSQILQQLSNPTGFEEVQKLESIEKKDSYRSSIRLISFFDEMNHKIYSSEVSFDDIASIISYTLTSDKYREYISPSQRIKLVDIKCKRNQKPFKDLKEIVNQNLPTGNIFKRISNQDENKEKGENKYNYSFFLNQDMEVYDTSLLFDQKKNIYMYPNLDINKINQQLETELLSDDKSQFSYTFSNLYLENQLTTLNMPVEWVYSDNSSYNTNKSKHGKNPSKSILHGLSLNNNLLNPISQNLNNSGSGNNDNCLINANMNKNLSNSANAASSNNPYNITTEAETNNNTNTNTGITNMILNNQPISAAEEKITLAGDSIKNTIDELIFIKKELKNVGIHNNNKHNKKIENQEINTQYDIEVVVYYPRQFEALRITYCASYEDFILSVILICLIYKINIFLIIFFIETKK